MVKNRYILFKCALQQLKQGSKAICSGLKGAWDFCTFVSISSMHLYPYLLYTLQGASKEPPLLSKSSFWVWAAPSTTLTLWSLSRNWVSILKELRSLPPSSMCTLWILLLNLSMPDVPFQYCNQLSSGAGFRPSLQPSWSPTIFPFLFAVEEHYGNRYQSGSFSLINVGSGFHCLRSFSFLFLAFS